VPTTTLLFKVLCALQAALAWWIARKERAHRGIAAWLGFLLVTVLVATPVRDALQTAPRRLTGFSLVLKVVDRAVYTGYYAALLAVCLYYFTRRRAWWWGFVFALLAELPFALHGYRPWPDRGAQMFVAIAVAGTALTWAFILRGLLVRRDLNPGLPHLLVMMYAGVEIGLLLVPYARDFFGHWNVIFLANYLLVLAGIAVQAGWLARRR
jgi:hypothetical protein